MYSPNSQIEFKSSMLKSILCVYSNAHILLNVAITVTETGAGDAAKGVDERNKDVIFKNCGPFIDCISGINNTQIDNAEDIDVVMPT